MDTASPRAANDVVRMRSILRENCRRHCRHHAV